MQRKNYMNLLKESILNDAKQGSVAEILAMQVMSIRSTLHPGSCKTSLDTSPLSKSLSLHCKKINKVKNELDRQPSSLFPHMHVSSYKATFSPIHLVFLELDTHRPHLDFKIPDENNNEVIPRTFYLQLLNKK